MSVKDDYLNQVLENIFVSDQRKERLEADLRNHFIEGRERGESDQEIVAKLGKPEEVARAFMDEIQLIQAGFWRRLLAFMVDMAFCFDLLLPLALPLISLVLLTSREGLEFELSIIPFVLISLVILTVMGIFILYFPLLESRFGRTLGKYLLGIRVIDESKRPVGLGAAILRRLSFYFEFLWIDALFIPFTAKQQRALDIVAKTLVIIEDSNRPVGRDLVFILLILAGPVFGFALTAALLFLSR